MEMDGKTIRLRASCNACNESKVRCSQRKPTCARCERNGFECIYGLSRRTHKDAPPISMSPSQRTRGPLRTSSSSIDINSSRNSNHKGCDSRSKRNCWSGLKFAKSATATPSTSTPNGGASPEPSMSTGMSAHDANMALFGDYMSHIPPYTTQTQTTADPAHFAGLLMDYTSVPRHAGVSSSGPHTDRLSAAVAHFSTPAAEYASPWAMGSLFSSSNTNTTTSNSDSGTAADMSAYLGTPPSPPSLGEYTCNCHAGVTELLTSVRGGGGGGGDDRKLPVDARLAKLERCISSSETSMACTHGRDDGEPIHIMAVATLIGYVIDGFELLACDLLSPAPRRVSPAAGDVAGQGFGGGTLSSGSDDSMSMVTPATGVSLMGLVEPSLSWGMLELEDDNEVDLRQRLYLLSFNKLERLLSQLTMYLRSLHAVTACLSDPSRHMAFVMACDYTRLWLEKKAEDVRRLLSASGGEMLDPIASTSMSMAH